MVKIIFLVLIEAFLKLQMTESLILFQFNKEEFLAELNRFNALDLRELSKKIKKDIHFDAAKKIADEIKQN